MTVFISRRELLKRAGLAGAAAVVAPGFASGDPARGVQATATAVRAVAREPLENLTAAESDVLEAIVARLIPSDANGPGAAEARAAHYIDRALGGALAPTRQSYTTGLAALDRYARSSRGGGFAQLSAADQDAVLTDVESGVADGFPTAPPRSLAMVRAHDPRHVLRSVLRRQRELRRLGPGRLSRRAHHRHARRAAPRRRRDPQSQVAYDYEMFTKASASAATSHDPHHGD